MHGLSVRRSANSETILRKRIGEAVYGFNSDSHGKLGDSEALTGCAVQAGTAELVVTRVPTAPSNVIIETFTGHAIGYSHAFCELKRP